MASRTLPGIALNGFWNLGEDDWKDGADANWRKLSALTQLSVIGLVASLPGSPANGMIYIVTSGVNANSVAVRDSGEWIYFTPSEGWMAWVRDQDSIYAFDGTSWINASPKVATLSLFSAGVMVDDERLMVFLASAAMTIPAGATGSLAHSEVAATAAAALPISKISGVTITSVGTVNFAAGVQAGTFTMASPVSLAVGDRLVISSPATADTTLADVSLSIRGTLT